MLEVSKTNSSSLETGGLCAAPGRGSDTILPLWGLGGFGYKGLLISGNKESSAGLCSGICNNSQHKGGQTENNSLSLLYIELLSFMEIHRHHACERNIFRSWNQLLCVDLLMQAHWYTHMSLVRIIPTPLGTQVLQPSSIVA